MNGKLQTKLSQSVYANGATLLLADEVWEVYTVLWVQTVKLCKIKNHS